METNFVPSNVFLRGILLHYFIMKKRAAETHRILVDVYGDNAPSERTCQKWFARFKSGNFDLEDEERSGQPKKFEDKDLEALLNEDSSQTIAQLARALGVTHQAVSHRLKAMGMVRQVGILALPFGVT